MKKNILQYLEASAERFPEKTVFACDQGTISYREFVSSAKRVGSCLLSAGLEGKNIAVFIDKSVNCLIGMFGAAYANACYTVIDVASPAERVNAILSMLNPACIITDEKNCATCAATERVLVIEQMLMQNEAPALLHSARVRQCDTDPLYILFTSGSTGVPKGSVICHRSVIAYACTVCETFQIGPETIWGSQTPFYFSMSVLDVFSTVVAGATLFIIPRMCFSFPLSLIECLNEQKINAIYWVPTVFNIVATFDTFAADKPHYLKKIFFAGESMPIKQLNYWMERLPDPIYVNLFGPTEVTDTCTYYIVDRHFTPGDSVPIGTPFDNCDVFVLDEDGSLVTPDSDREGILYVRGTFLGLGYYNDPEKTREVFVQDPRNNAYPETVYKTGDIVAYNTRGELIFKGRKDHQIKHMGHRIELGEVENAAAIVEGIDRTCCIYDDRHAAIVLFYTGTPEETKVRETMKDYLPTYMIPKKCIRLTEMPINMNGKIDRVKLTNRYL